MAIFTTAPGIDDVTGKFSKKDRIVMRKKQFKYPNGKIFGCGPKEAFARDKRDYKRSPRTEAEEVQHARWTALCQEASRIEHDPNHPRYQEMVERHLAQLKGQPDPVLGKKRICQFGNFIRSVLSHESKI